MKQFIGPFRKSMLTIVGVVIVLIGVVFIILSGYCLLASQMSKWLTNPKSLEIVNKTSGASLIVAGGFTATLQKG